MSGAIATAYVKLIPTFDGQLTPTIQKQLGQVDGSKAGSKVGRLFSRGVDSGMSGLGTSMTSRFSAATVAVGNIAARAFTSAFSAISPSMDEAINRADTLNNFPRIMEGMGIGADASSAAIKRLSGGIDGLPTALDDAVSGVSRFTAKNGDIAKSTDYFLAVNNAIAAGGASMQVQSSALEQLFQSYSKGKMDMMEWRSLQQAMPAQLNQIAKAMGMTADELGEGLRGGEVSMDAFMGKIVELNEEGVEGLDSFERQARKATGGIGTAMTNVRNRINKAVAGILDAIGQENISGAINAFSSKFGKIGSIIGGTDAEGNVVGFVAGLKDGLSRALDGWEPQFGIDWDAAFGGAIEAAQKLGGWLSGPLASFMTSWDGALSRVGSAWDELSGKLRLPEIDWEGISGGISKIIELTADFSADAIVSAMTAFSEIGQGLSDAFGPFVEKIGPGLESAAQGIGEFVSPIADFITGQGPAFDGMMERIQGHIDDMAPILEDISVHFNHLAETLEPIAGPVGQFVAEVLGNILSALVGLATIGVAAIDTVMDAIDGLVTTVNGIGEALGPVVGEFLGWLGLLPPEMQEVTDQADGITKAVEGIPSEKTVTVRADDRATGVLSGIIGRLREISAGATARVGTYANGFAAGGVSRNQISPAPRHADGGIAGIVDRPLLTNIGWVGEAGSEAIIPLTNSRYVRPFARAVASEMGGGRQVVNNVKVTLDWRAGADANQMVDELADALNRRSLLEA